MTSRELTGQDFSIDMSAVANLSDKSEESVFKMLWEAWKNAEDLDIKLSVKKSTYSSSNNTDVDDLINAGPTVVPSSSSGSEPQPVQASESEYDSKLPKLYNKTFPDAVTVDIGTPVYLDGDYTPNVIDYQVDQNYLYNTRMLQLYGQIMNASVEQVTKTLFYLQQPVRQTTIDTVTGPVTDTYSVFKHTLINPQKNLYQFHNKSGVILKLLGSNLVMPLNYGLNVPIPDTTYRMIDFDFDLVTKDKFTVTSVVTSNVDIDDNDVIEIKYTLNFNKFVERAFGSDISPEIKTRLEECVAKIEESSFSMYVLTSTAKSYQYVQPQSLFGYINCEHLIDFQEELFEFEPVVLKHHTRFFNLYDALINNLPPSEYKYRILHNITTSVTTVSYEQGIVEDRYANTFAIEEGPFMSDSKFRALYYSDYSDIISYVYSEGGRNMIPQDIYLNVGELNIKSKLDNLTLEDVLAAIPTYHVDIQDKQPLIARRINLDDFIQTSQEPDVYFYSTDQFEVYSLVPLNLSNPVTYKFKNSTVAEYYKTTNGISSTGLGMDDLQVIKQTMI
jgi:hypothetical protein